MNTSGIVFRGRRHRAAALHVGDAEVVVVDILGDKRERVLPLQPSLDVMNHSPNGFEWGYAGSGPAQLALAMLLELGIGGDRAERFHQQVKFALIVGLPRDDPWEISGDAVLRALQAAERRGEQ